MSDARKSRLKTEYGKFKKQNEFMVAIPDPANIDQWHITIKGMKDTPFEGGYYHFLLDLAPYPDNPPNVKALNENGSFALDTQLCIQNFSSHHKAQWHSNFEVLQMCSVIQSIMCLRYDQKEASDIKNGVGFLPINPEKAKAIAVKTQDYVCPQCQKRLGEYKFPY